MNKITLATLSLCLSFSQLTLASDLTDGDAVTLYHPDTGFVRTKNLPSEGTIKPTEALNLSPQKIDQIKNLIRKVKLRIKQRKILQEESASDIVELMGDEDLHEILMAIEVSAAGVSLFAGGTKYSNLIKMPQNHSLTDTWISQYYKAEMTKARSFFAVAPKLTPYGIAVVASMVFLKITTDKLAGLKKEIGLTSNQIVDLEKLNAKDEGMIDGLNLILEFSTDAK